MTRDAKVMPIKEIAKVRMTPFIVLTAVYSQAKKSPEGPHVLIHNPGQSKGLYGFSGAFLACVYTAVSAVEPPLGRQELLGALRAL